MVAGETAVASAGAGCGDDASNEEEATTSRSSRVFILDAVSTPGETGRMGLELGEGLLLAAGA
jgi:hypothetical protein